MTEAPMQAIERRLAAGEIVLIDGATGTELERRGAPMHDDAWCAAATLSHGDLLRAVHEDYVRAGASVIIANTYASNRLMLDPAGLGEEFGHFNRRAVEIALEARDRAAGDESVAVAGSMSHMMPVAPVNGPYDPAHLPSPEHAAACYVEIATLLADAGADLIVMEMMSDPDFARPAVAAATATGLPVWIGYSAVRGAKGEPVAFRRPELGLAEVVRAVQPPEASVAGVMHSHVDLTGPALAAVREAFDGPTMAYPDSGRFEMPHWNFTNVVSPAVLADAAREWIDDGAAIVGGCCGLGLEHIEALAEMIARR